ncbi:hypothetical protein GCM10018952_16730 [Streptosporangium vulgare]
MKKHVLSAILATIAIICSLVAFSTPASATTIMYHESDYAYLDDVGGGVIYAEVCDQEAGNAVYLEYQLYGVPGTYKLWDLDGGGGGCGQGEIGIVSRARICENNVSCRGWYNAPF